MPDDAAVAARSARVLPDGLIVRAARPDDRSALVELQGMAHAGADGTPNTGVAAWTEDLFDRPHPTVTLDDVSVVVDPDTGRLVSSVTLVRQVWEYAGIPLGVGRLELVATHPDYRGRGLTSRQMHLLRERSTAAGDLLQVITDLMYYHGELGYHSALVQRAGRGGQVAELPATPADAPLELRPATLDDVPFLESVQRRGLLCCPRDAALWEYELVGRTARSMVRDEFLVVWWRDRPVGFAQLGYGGIPSFPVPGWLPGLAAPEPLTPVSGLELTRWELAPAVLRAIAAERGHTGFLLWLGERHPAYDALAGYLNWKSPSIGWFVHVPDLVGLLTAVAPELENRLAASPVGGFTGRLRLHFYTHGVWMEFAEGRITSVRPWPGHSRRGADVSMPEQMFRQLLFGHATLTELAPAYPDHRVQNRTGAALLGALFAKHPSHIWPLI